MKKKINIKIVVMNPEAIPYVQKKLFDFFYERFINEISKESNTSSKKEIS